jgi:hypothetical protein
MTEEQLIRKIEWADKRCSLIGEPFTETQKDYLKFVFAGMTSEKSDFIDHVSNSVDNETLVEDCEEYSHNQCDCVGKYCQYGK